MFRYYYSLCNFTHPIRGSRLTHACICLACRAEQRITGEESKLVTNEIPLLQKQISTDEERLANITKEMREELGQRMSAEEESDCAALPDLIRAKKDEVGSQSVSQSDTALCVQAFEGRTNPLAPPLVSNAECSSPRHRVEIPCSGVRLCAARVPQCPSLTTCAVFVLCVLCAAAESAKPRPDGCRERTGDAEAAPVAKPGAAARVAAVADGAG